MTRTIRMVGAGLVVAVVLVAGPVGLRAEHEATTPAQEMIEETIRDYLLSHPDVMIEVSDILRARQEAVEADAARLNLASYREELLNDPAAPVAGNPNGDVTLVEFFDYHCTYCKRVMPAMMQSLGEDPGLRIVYKEFPILGPDSVIASRAALAVHRIVPDTYLDFHIALMSSRARLNEMRILGIAEELGIDTDALQAEMKNPEIAAIIERNRALAEALGINGTPGFVIGDRVIPGAIDIETMRGLIAEARQS